MKNNSLVIGTISIVLCTLIFSTMEVLLKMPAVSGAFTHMQITVLRFLIGGIALIPFARRSLHKKGISIAKEHYKRFAFTGLLCVPLSMVLYQMAISYGQASIIAILFSANPIFVTILAFIILKEAIHWNNILALCCSIAGIIAIINPFSGTTDVNTTSVVLIIISALLFASYSVMGKKMTKQYGGLVVTCMSFLFGGAELLFLLILGRFDLFSSIYESIGLSIFCDVPFFTGINSVTLPYFLTICLVNSAAGYVFHMMALENMGAHMTNLVFFFKPIVAPIIAFFVLQEAITQNMIVGICLFLAGSLCGIIPPMIRARREAHLHAQEAVAESKTN